ncbi:MAG: hypothetical protein ACRC2T_06990 [Thermoguttaceae bacterium]
MLRFINYDSFILKTCSFVLCLLFIVPCGLAETPEEFRERYFKVGQELLSEADTKLKKENLGDDFYDVMNLNQWGNALCYADNPKKYVEASEQFIREIEKRSQSPDWSHTLINTCTTLFKYEIELLKSLPKDKMRSEFEKLCDKYVPAFENIRKQENDYFTYLIPLVAVHFAEAVDPEGSLGLAQIAVEKFKPDFSNEELTGYLHGFIRRATATGKPMVFNGLNPDKSPFDIKDLNGKTSLVLFINPVVVTDEWVSIAKELNDVLSDQPFVIVKYIRAQEGGSYSSPSDQFDEQQKRLPGMVVRSQKIENNFYGGMGGGLGSRPNTFFEYYTAHSIRSKDAFEKTLVFFLVGPNGEVLLTDSHVFPSTLFARLKSMFPKKEKELAKLESDAQARELVDKKVEDRIQALKESGSAEGKLISIYQYLDDTFLLTNVCNLPSMEPYNAAYVRSRKYSSFVREFPEFKDIPDELRFEILWNQCRLRQLDCAWQLSQNKKLKPEVVFKDLENDIISWRKTNPNHPRARDISSIRRDIICSNMLEHLKRLPADEQQEYAKLIINKYVEFVKEVLTDSSWTPLELSGIASDFRILTPNLLKTFDEISPSGKTDLHKDLATQLVPIFLKSNNDELKELAITLMDVSLGK